MKIKSPPTTWQTAAIMEIIKVTDTDQGERLDIFLAEKLSESRTRIKKLIEAKSILVNNAHTKASYIISSDDEINLTISPPQKLELKGKEIPLDIIYEDTDFIVINKPVGLVVHPGAGTDDNTLVHALLHHCQDLSGIGGVERPGIIHRLDKDTSGIILIAKNDNAHKKLSEQFKKRTIKKTYLALIEGTIKEDEGEINYPIGRNPKNRKKMTTFREIPENLSAKSAVTHYKVLGQKEHKALLEVTPLTGRTHQIRVHLAAIGHPIIGDPLYGNKHGKRQLLHAYKISFFHPSTGQMMEFSAPLPLWAKNYC